MYEVQSRKSCLPIYSVTRPNRKIKLKMTLRTYGVLLKVTKTTDVHCFYTDIKVLDF